MAYFHTTVLDNQIKALPTIKTASGSVANFTTDMQENLVEVECEIVYSQASGTPSPSNPLPITTYTSLNLSHSGSDTSNPTITNIPFGQTIAKGKLNVTTGVLEITHGVVDLGSITLNWDIYQYGVSNTFYSIFPDKKNGLDNFRSNEYENYSGAIGQMPDLTIRGQANSNTIFIRNTNFSDVPTFKTSLSGVQFVYELATPTIVQLSSTQVTALLNENNIWCDTGSTSVKFILSVGEYVNQNV